MQSAADLYADGEGYTYASDWVVYQIELDVLVPRRYLVQDLEAFVHHLEAWGNDRSAVDVSP